MYSVQDWSSKDNILFFFFFWYWIMSSLSAPSVSKSCEHKDTGLDHLETVIEIEMFCCCCFLKTRQTQTLNRLCQTEIWNFAACYFFNIFSTLWKRFPSYFDICWTMIRIFERGEGKVISASGKAHSFNSRLIKCASNDNFYLWLIEKLPKSYFFQRYIRLQQVAFNSHWRHNKCP